MFILGVDLKCGGGFGFDAPPYAGTCGLCNEPYEGGTGGAELFGSGGPLLLFSPVLDPPNKSFNSP